MTDLDLVDEVEGFVVVGLMRSIIATGGLQNSMHPGVQGLANEAPASQVRQVCELCRCKMVL